uniref:Lipoprotein n=1 Tax=Strongyloides papillosus TaxID=174720 RepID=A0A0N5CI31_STREA
MRFSKSLIFFIVALIIIICCSVIGNILYFVNYNEESYCFSSAYGTSKGNAGLYLLHVGNALSLLFFIVAIIGAFAISRSREFSLILLVICVLRAIINLAGIILLAIALTDYKCNPAKAIVGLLINMIGIFIVIIFLCLGLRSRSYEDEGVYQ